MSGRVFVDTNVLVYAHDTGSGDKHELAVELVEELWRDRRGVLSTQVLQEFYVNVRRKSERPLECAEAQRLIEDYLAWEVVVSSGDAIVGAIELESRFKLSFWDAMILHAATMSGVETLYSEDFNHGQLYGTVRVVNPLGR